MITPTKEMNFAFDKDKKIGHVRIQFNGKGLLANQFIQTMDGDINQVADIKLVNGVVNEINNWVKDYDNLVDNLCDSQEGFDKEVDYFYIDDNANFWIRVLPIGEGDYNLYIHIYKK